MDAAIAAKVEPPAAASPERRPRLHFLFAQGFQFVAKRLVDALNARDFEAYLDKNDILPGEPWKDRLKALILSADTVGVVISADSIASPMCAWEVETAESLQKKMLPLVYRPVADADVPPRLAQLNYIFLREADDFNSGLSTVGACPRYRHCLDSPTHAHRGVGAAVG